MRFSVTFILGTMSALALCAPLNAHSTASQDPARIVVYLLKFAHNKEYLSQRILAETSNEPRLRALVQEVFVKYDYETLGSRLSGQLSQELHPDEITQCMRFIASSEGGALMEVSQSAASLDELPQRLSLAPPMVQQAASKFFNSDCVKKTTASMASKAGQAIIYAYGTEAVCDHARQTSTEMLGLLNDNGVCHAP